MIKTASVNLTREWEGLTAACIASGCSLTQSQVDAVKGLKIIVVNDCYRLAPWADILYACDARWWDWNKGCPDFNGRKITHETEVRFLAETPPPNPPYRGAELIISSGEYGFDKRTNRIKHGGNSGYQALHITMHLGASRIILLGYDMHNRSGAGRWSGKHPVGDNYSDNLKFAKWIQGFGYLADAAIERNQEIINCTPDSAIECFKKADLWETLMQI